MSRLNDLIKERDARILVKYDEGAPPKEIAETEGVSISTFWRVVRARRSRSASEHLGVGRSEFQPRSAEKRHRTARKAYAEQTRIDDMHFRTGTFVHNLREMVARKDVGTLALSVRMTKDTLSRAEVGLHRWTLVELTAIADYFGISLTRFFDYVLKPYSVFKSEDFMGAFLERHRDSI